MSTKVLKYQVNSQINDQLGKIFEMIDYKHPFQMKLSDHAAVRVSERIIGPDRIKLFSNLIKRIVKFGACELLYYHSRYVNGEIIRNVEFINEDVVAPISFVGDYVVIRTIFLLEEGYNRDDFEQIDLGDSRVLK